MPKDVSADLMRALIAKLYTTITVDNPDIKMPRNKFVTWMSPGLPFKPEDFSYCSKGFVGETGEETLQLYHQAWTSSRLFDFVPDVSKQVLNADMQQSIFTSTQDTISSVYSDVLKYSKVVDINLTEDQKKKLEKFRSLITVTKKLKDIVTEEETEVTEPGPIVVAYEAKMKDYITAVNEYINLLLDAQSAKGSDPEAIRRVNAFANKSSLLRQNVEAAWMAWVSQGYKNDYEKINAYIDQVTQKSMVLYKSQLQEDFRKGKLTNPLVGAAGDFYYTSLVPGNFATSPGWTKFSYYETDYEENSKKSTNQWGTEFTIFYGLYHITPDVKGNVQTTNIEHKATNFKATFEFVQVPIVRPWFKPGFFSMRGWILDNSSGAFGSDVVSDGMEGKTDQEPKGRLVAYPTTALFVRDVSFKFDEADDMNKDLNVNISNGVRVGWGPFSIGGSYILRP